MLSSSNKLKRSLSLPMVVLYGMGTILGAGIYVLIGEVAGVAGINTPLSFFVGAILAGFSSFSYAELSSRFPKSAGEAVYVQEGMGKRWFSIIVGLMVILVGIVSSATIAKGFVGYLHVFYQLPSSLAVSMLIITLGLIAWWGIKESVFIASILTLLELFGLLLIIWIGWDNVDKLPVIWNEIKSQQGLSFLPGVLLGAFLTFYAFIGFEDIVNVAEEVKQPQRTLPAAIILVLIFTTIIYIAVAMAAIVTVSPDQLSGQGAPLSYIYEIGTGNKPVVITLIGMFAVVNGALVQIIMGSRILYGMGNQGWLPTVFSKIHPKTRTPHIATLLVTVATLIFALWLPLVTLAKTTSLITLLIFSFINLALILVKLRDPKPDGVMTYPLWLPIAGFISNLAFIAYQLFIILSE
ncbi:MAG: APC family permease [Gammaproteobacteria bacterium]